MSNLNLKKQKMIIKEIGKIKDNIGGITIIHNSMGWIRIKQPGLAEPDIIDIDCKNIKKLITILKKIK